MALAVWGGFLNVFPGKIQMALQKHHRLALQAVRNLCPGMQAQLQPARKHPKLVAHYAGWRVQVTLSSTPSCAEDVVRNCVRDVLRRFAASGIALTT
jgi:hypothetical protein